MPETPHHDPARQYPPLDLRRPYTAKHRETINTVLRIRRLDAWNEALEEFVNAIVEAFKTETDDSVSRAEIATYALDDLFTTYGEYYGGGCVSNHDPGEDFLDHIAELLSHHALNDPSKAADIVTRLVELQGTNGIPLTTAVLDAFVMWVCGEIKTCAASGRTAALWKGDILRALNEPVRGRFELAFVDAVFDTIPPPPRW